MRNSNRAYQQLKNKILKLSINNLVNGKVYYSNGLLNSGTHFVVLMEYILGEILSLKPLSTKKDLIKMIMK